MDNIS